MHADRCVQADWFGLIRIVRICAGLKPGFASERLYKLFIKSPALTTNTSVSATSAAMSQLRSCVQVLAVNRWPPLLMDSVRLICQALQAGAIPNARPVHNASAAMA